MADITKTVSKVRKKRFSAGAKFTVMLELYEENRLDPLPL